MIIQIIKDGAKNVSILVKGVLEENLKMTPIIDLEKLQMPSQGWKGLRLDSAVWAIQEKMGFHLWWDECCKEEHLVLPMESRNAMRFDEGIPSPRVEAGWKGVIYLSSFRQDDPQGFRKWYFILLDFDKQ